MDHWKGLSTVFNCWNFCFTIITQWWAMVDFITQNGPIFHKIFKIFVVINQKPCDVCGQKLVWVVSTIGSTNTPSFVKIREVTQNSLLIWHGMTHNWKNFVLQCIQIIFTVFADHENLIMWIVYGCEPETKLDWAGICMRNAYNVYSACIMITLLFVVFTVKGCLTESFHGWNCLLWTIRKNWSQSLRCGA